MFISHGACVDCSGSSVLVFIIKLDYTICVQFLCLDEFGGNIEIVILWADSVVLATLILIRVSLKIICGPC